MVRLTLGVITRIALATLLVLLASSTPLRAQTKYTNDEINAETNPVTRDLMRYGYDRSAVVRITEYIERGPNSMEPSGTSEDLQGFIRQLDQQVNQRREYSGQTQVTLDRLRGIQKDSFPERPAATQPPARRDPPPVTREARTPTADGQYTTEEINGAPNAVTRDLMRYGYDRSTVNRVTEYLERGPFSMEPSGTREDMQGYINQLEQQINRRGSYSMQTRETLDRLKALQKDKFPEQPAVAQTPVTRTDPAPTRERRRPLGEPSTDTPTTATDRPGEPRPQRRLTREERAQYPAPEGFERRRDGGILNDRQREALSSDGIRGVRIGEGDLQASTDGQRNRFVLRGGGLNYTEFAYRYEHEGRQQWVYQVYNENNGHWQTPADQINGRLREIRVRDHAQNGRYQERVTQYSRRGDVDSVTYTRGRTRDASPFSAGTEQADGFRPRRTEPVHADMAHGASGTRGGGAPIPPQGANIRDITGPTKAPVAVPPPKQPTPATPAKTTRV